MTIRVSTVKNLRSPIMAGTCRDTAPYMRIGSEVTSICVRMTGTIDQLVAVSCSQIYRDGHHDQLTEYSTNNAAFEYPYLVTELYRLSALISAKLHLNQVISANILHQIQGIAIAIHYLAIFMLK